MSKRKRERKSLARAAAAGPGQLTAVFCALDSNYG